MAIKARSNSNGSISLTVPKQEATLMQLEPGQDLEFQVLDTNTLVVSKANKRPGTVIDIDTLTTALLSTVSEIWSITSLSDTEKRKILKRKLIEIARGV